jgi:pyruvate dehydrogenase E2 component (dihydrolipoamide acetyltransferase)
VATDVLMPRLSDSMEEGTVLKWLVDKGGDVRRGEPLVEIETDKANMTYEADTDGTLVEILAEEGETLAIGELIARIGQAGEASSAGGASAETDDGAGADEPGAEAGGSAQPGADQAQSGATEPKPLRSAPAAEAGGSGTDSDNGRIKASPVARRMAGEMGVELARLEGTGPGGRIVKADVEAAAKDGGGTAAPAPPAGPEPVAAGEAGAKGTLHVQELTRLQQTVSRRMAESKATTPDFQINVEIDMTRCVELRARLKELTDPAPSYNDMVVKACANALRELPRVNGAYRDGRFELYGRVNVGIAVAAQGTLVVPTIFDADQKSLGRVAEDARRLIDRVRDASITPPELSGGTFTVSNLGMYGIDSFSAVINPPQAAILAVGRLAKKPTVDGGGQVVARDMMGVTLVCDHRILYGADGAEFLARVRALLQQPLSLAL